MKIYSCDVFFSPYDLVDLVLHETLCNFGNQDLAASASAFFPLG